MKLLGFVCRVSVIAAIGVFLCTAPAGALDPARQCRKDARKDRSDCLGVCRDNYQAAILLCGTPCVRACEIARKACKGPIQDTLTAAIKACNDTRTAAIKSCRAQRAADPAFDLGACIDAAQIAAFICRDDARETAFPALNTCRENYQVCIRACP